MSRAIVEGGRVVKAVSTLIDTGDINHVEHLVVVIERLIQVVHDHSVEWGNDRSGLDSCDDPADEAHFQVGYTCSVVADLLGYRSSHDKLRAMLNVRKDIAEAVTYFKFDTCAHGQSRNVAQ